MAGLQATETVTDMAAVRQPKEPRVRHVWQWVITSAVAFLLVANMVLLGFFISQKFGPPGGMPAFAQQGAGPMSGMPGMGQMGMGQTGPQGLGAFMPGTGGSGDAGSQPSFGPFGAR